MDIIEIPTEEVVQEKVQYKNPKVKVVEKHYETPKIEISKNIQRFDKKVKVYTENPYSYNAISLKKKDTKIYNPGAEALLTNPTYNTIGKFLGVDAVHDWNRYSDKVYTITEWAKKKTGTEDLNKLIKWIGTRAKSVPNMGNKLIDNLYIYARLSIK